MMVQPQLTSHNERTFLTSIPSAGTGESLYMRPRLPPLLQNLHPSSTPMARAILRSTTLSSATMAHPTKNFFSLHSSSALCCSTKNNSFDFKSSLFAKAFHSMCRARVLMPIPARAFAAQRGYRRVRKWAAAASRRENELQLNVAVCIEEGLPDDPEILSIAELLRLNVPMAMKLAFDGLKDSKSTTRVAAISDLGGFESVELSVLLCNDEFIRELNKEWRDEDHATDVLSMSQHVPELKLPILMLGDIVISVETAVRQAEERGHSLVDEIRILLVHGMLHLLGFDHEISEKAEIEMEKEEELLLKNLGWKGKGLIQSAYDAEISENLHSEKSDECNDLTSKLLKDRKKEGSLRFYKPRFNYIFCDMDGTLLNSNRQISLTNAKALKEALSRGVKVVIATGKARPSVIDLMKKVGLAGKDGVISEFSPGIFLQGLLVYGRQGQEILRRKLDPSVCREAGLYSLEHKIPLVAFTNERCLTLFDHPLVDSLHTVYREPKAEIMPSVEHLVAAGDMQKLMFLDTIEGVANVLRPYWSEASGECVNVVQAVPDMLEIVPHGTSKAEGVKLLLDHLGITSKEIMAIGDGENDIEMLELASLGVALSNGSDKTKAVADVVGVSNDEDGVADAIYRYAF